MDESITQIIIEIYFIQSCTLKKQFSAFFQDGFQLRKTDRTRTVQI